MKTKIDDLLCTPGIVAHRGPMACHTRAVRFRHFRKCVPVLMAGAAALDFNLLRIDPCGNLSMRVVALKAIFVIRRVFHRMRAVSSRIQILENAVVAIQALIHMKKVGSIFIYIRRMIDRFYG